MGQASHRNEETAEISEFLSLVDRSIAALNDARGKLPYWPDGALLQDIIESRLEERERYGTMTTARRDHGFLLEINGKREAMQRECELASMGPRYLVSHLHALRRGKKTAYSAKS